MIDLETFLTELYVMVDDFCKIANPARVKPGVTAALSAAEIITLATLGQWFHFGSERGFYRYACRHLRAAFPKLPSRPQLNRAMRGQHDGVVAFGLHVVEKIGRHEPYEALDASAVPTRDINRRGQGWLPGIAHYGVSKRLGYFEGVNLLVSVLPCGAITGFGFGSGNVKDSTLADTFLAARAQPQPRLTSVGQPAAGDYVADKGFSNDALLSRWRWQYQANIICAPRKNSQTRHWPKQLRRWLAGLRQVVETVYDKLHNTFRLASERPHDLTGLQLRLAAKVALHNFCLFFNVQLGRQPLAFADLIAW